MEEQVDMHEKLTLRKQNPAKKMVLQYSRLKKI